MKAKLGSKISLFFGMAFLLAILGITTSCKKTVDELPGSNDVIIQGMTFSPSTITITSGTTVTWTNKDGDAHTVTSNTGLFESGSISHNGTYSHIFNTVGSFPYHCSIHPAMTASVVVN